jgi:hypothetical protein
MAVDLSEVMEPAKMGKEEAQQLFDKIVNTTREYKIETSFLLLRLDRERGWEALGYKSWRECATAMGAQLGIEERSLYKWHDWAEVNDNLSRGTGKIVRLPETHALALKDLEPEQQLLAFAQVTEGKEDQRPPAAAFEKAARKVAPAAAPKKKRKAEREDGWTKEELQKDSQLAMALVSIAGVWGSKDVDAIRNGTVPLKRADVLVLAALHKPKLVEIQDLVMGERWTPERALKFVNSMPDENTTLEEMRWFCLATKGKYYEATVDGFAYTVKATRAARR